MATKEKKAPVLNVGYSDKSAVITVTNPSDDSEVASLNVKELAGDATPDTMVKASIRYFAGGIRDTISAGEKAKKALDDITLAVLAMIESVIKGTLQFRERGGEGGLSTEQEFDIIAGVLMSLGVCATMEEALSAVKAKYDVTKEVITPAKGTAAIGKEGEPGYVAASADYREEKKSLTRPEYRKLKAVPDVAAALTKAEKIDSVGELAALGIKKAA